MKIYMFFGNSILEAFWEDLGRVLASQKNPRFSHVFRCFFEPNFEACIKRLQNPLTSAIPVSGCSTFMPPGLTGGWGGLTKTTKAASLTRQWAKARRIVQDFGNIILKMNLEEQKIKIIFQDSCQNMFEQNH